MVFIHGGGLITGAGHWRDLTTVRNLVSKGVIVASLEYRMSWLGKQPSSAQKSQICGFSDNSVKFFCRNHLFL